MKSPYDEKTEEQMLSYYGTLSERERRHYSAVEATKLGRGGQSYISSLFHISRKVIRRGQRELSLPDPTAGLGRDRQRRSGGGRKKKRLP
jgi:hypothetical protein